MATAIAPSHRPAPHRPIGATGRHEGGTALDARRVRAAISDPATAGTDAILELQRTSGNRAVEQLLHGHGIQARLTVGAGDDPHEREADRIADEVTRPSARSASQLHAIGPVPPVAQRHSLPPKPSAGESGDEPLDEALQRKADGGQAGPFEASTAVEAAVRREAGRGRGLELGLRSDMERRFGADFSGVRVHDGSTAVQLNRAVGANAFTHGKDIFFAAGQFDPATAGGRRLVAHELTHVVQQSGGRGTRVVQRDNIVPGANLPTVKKMAKKRRGETLGEDRIYKAEVRTEQVTQLQQLLGATTKLQADFTTAFKELADVKAGMSKGDPKATTNRLLRKVEAEASPNLSTTAGRALVADMKGTGKVAAKAMFTAARGNAALQHAYVDPADLDGFAAALKTLSSVQQVIQRGRGAGGQRPAPTTTGGKQWGAGGKFSDNVIANRSSWISPLMHKVRAMNEMASFKRKLDRVDAWFRSLLEQDVMLHVTRLPQILMETRGRARHLGSERNRFFVGDIGGYRPNADATGVHLPYNERAPVIAHELGHAIEGWLPMHSWHDMNLLLEKRHEHKVGPTDRAARPGANMYTSGTEGRYAGTYVTGKYTSAAYDTGGNAEVFSMAIEFFAKPDDALRLIEGDPQHAAVILRAIAPDEYRKNPAVQCYNKYLPS